MQNVSIFEASLLRLLSYFLRREPPERALPLVERRVQAPPCLSRPAVDLVKDALGKGCVFLLAQRGGWRDERHLRGAKLAAGRLWQRTKPEDLGLEFSRHSLAFLIWITSARPGDKDPGWQPPANELTPADLLLLFFAHEGLRDTVDSLGAPALRKRAPYSQHGLCWLAYPEDFAAACADGARPNFTPWMTGLGACMLEALQPDLLTRWLQVEGSKERLADAQLMRGIGQSQDVVLTAFLDACEKAGRRDLARFLLRAASHLVTRHAHPTMWTGALQLGGMRLADRAATYQAATAFLRHLDRLAAWTRWARSSGRFDDGYQAAKLWLADWEDLAGSLRHRPGGGVPTPLGLGGDDLGAAGDELHERAQAIVRSLDPMRQAAEGAARPAT
jgi:hypothetical protein